MAGRPTLYKSCFALVARTMSLDGANQATIAPALGASASALHKWMKRYPEFAATMRAAATRRDERHMETLNRFATLSTPGF